MKKLSEIIESYRIDRPDEWTVDALKRRAEALEVDRDSILAELQKANAMIIDLQHNPPKLAKEFLAEIKAEAIEQAATYLSESIQDVDYKAVIFQDRYAYISTRYMREYAAKIRNAGTWLRDSNVNGRKRQSVQNE